MFNPTTDDVRRFFCQVWQKQRDGSVLSPLEALAADWIGRHPEYHEELGNVDAAIARDYRIDDGRTNPFLHLAMHVAISEQMSIDQPSGIRGLMVELSNRLGDAHAAMHEAMECLGQTLWEAQRDPSVSAESMSARYLECLQRRVAR